MPVGRYFELSDDAIYHTPCFIELNNRKQKKFDIEMLKNLYGQHPNANALNIRCYADAKLTKSTTRREHVLKVVFKVFFVIFAFICFDLVAHRTRHGIK